MPEIPFTNTRQQVLFSMGDGQNTSYWGAAPSNNYWFANATTTYTLNASVPSSSPWASMTVSGISGYSRYLVLCQFAQNNTNATGTGACEVQFETTGGVVATQTLGYFNTTTRNQWSTSTIIVPNANDINNVGGFSISVYPYSNTAQTAVVAYGTINVIGLA